MTSKKYIFILNSIRKHLLADCSCSYGHCKKQRHFNYVSSTLARNVGLRCSTRNTRCRILIRITSGFVRMVCHWNNSLRFLWTESIECCSTNFDILTVIFPSLSNFTSYFLLYSTWFYVIPVILHSLSCIRLVLRVNFCACIRPRTIQNITNYGALNYQIDIISPSHTTISYGLLCCCTFHYFHNSICICLR